MAFTNSTANVKGPLISAIALCAPAADFSAGVEVGMKKPSKLNVSQNSVEMSSKNAFPDSYKNELSTALLQNDFATLLAINGYAEGFVQAYMKTAGGKWRGYVGADSDNEKIMGLDYEWKFNAKDDEIDIKLMTELAAATQTSIEVESAPAGVTWASGTDATLRGRPGIKKVTFGGAPLGNLKSAEGSVKSQSVNVQLGRPLSNGVMASVKLVMAQTSKADVTAALAAASGSDTVIITFWSGKILKLSNLLAGKSVQLEEGEKDELTITIGAFFPKGSTRIIINTTPGTFELVFLDNLAQA